MNNKEFYPVAESILAFLRRKGFRFDEKVPDTWFHFGEDIYVGIFDWGCETFSQYAGKIIAGPRSTYDKWSNGYYVSGFPASQVEYETLLAHLKDLYKPEHIKAANGMGEWINDFYR